MRMEMTSALMKMRMTGALSSNLCISGMPGSYRVTASNMASGKLVM